MIHVIATITVHPGRRADFIAEFHKVVPAVLKEDGCIAYGPTVDLPTGLPPQVPIRADVVTIVEAWRDLAALRAHLVAPHMGEYRARVKDIVVGAQLQVLEPA